MNWTDIQVTTTQPMVGPWRRVVLRACKVGSVNLWQVAVLYEGDLEEETKEFTGFIPANDYYEEVR